MAGKVFIVTGGNAGIGLELIKMLYAKGATVYMAGRSPSKMATEIENITAQANTTPGVLKSLQVDLGDLTTVDMSGPPGGLLLSEQEPGKHNQDKAYNYSASKAGNWFLASELDKRTARKAGITSVAVNPGNGR